MRLLNLVRNNSVAAPAICCLVAASMWSTQADAQGFFRKRSRVAQAQAEKRAEVTETTNVPEEISGEVRLMYVSTSWEKVLNDVAKKTGLTLVMLDTPPGSFSRRDIRTHSREDAVAILNRELERRGFRIVVKDNFLTVMKTRRNRMEYERPLTATPEAQSQVVPVSNTVQNETTQERQPQSLPQIPGSRGIEIPTQVPRRRASTPSPQHDLLRPVAHNDLPEQHNSAIQQHETKVYNPKHRSAVDLARQIHQSFQSRSQLEDKGPNGLPAFVVSDFKQGEEDPGTLFVIEIDSDNERLLVTASENVQSGLKTLMNRIDVNPIAGEGVPSLMAGEGKTAKIAERLQRPISMIAQSQQLSRRGNAGELVAQVPQDQVIPQNVPPQPANPGDAARIMGRGGLMTLSGNLKGDVTIETIPGFDLLIIRGNEGDIETVMEVIQEIEKMAVGSLPEIHLLMLQHVDSRSLAQLLNNVYEQLAELRSESAQQSAASVNVVPVVVPNAVLILAPSNTMEAILDLAAELDQEIDPTHEIEVVRMEYANATSVVEILQGFYPDEDPEGLSTRLRVAADPRTNSVIVQAEPRDLSEIIKFIKELDADEAASIAQMRVVKLKNAVAEELAEFLSAAFLSVTDPQASTVSQTLNRQTQTQTDPKSVVLEFIKEDGEKLARSGLLDNIVFNAEPRTNTLQFSASPQSIPLIEELIKILDQPSSAVLEVKYFKLLKADAVNAVDLLNELFAVDETTGQNDSAAIGVQLVNATDTASTLVPPRFVADTRTNSVIATGGADTMIIVEQLLYRLDSTDPANRQQDVVKLLNVEAAVVALAINDFLTAQRDLATIDPDRISTSQLLEQEIIVIPEEATNTLLISATPAYFDQITTLIKKIDAEFAQVQISALLIEVTLDNTDEFGVELGFQDPVFFDRSTLENVQTITETVFDAVGNPTATDTRIISAEATPGFAFNNQPLGLNSGDGSRPAHIATQGLSNFALQRTNNDLGYGGLVLSAGSDSVNVLIRALASRRQVRVLSRPIITTLDNVAALIQVGQEVPVVDGVNQTVTSTIPLIVRDNAGIILQVQPRINPDGQIVMNVTAEKSTFTDTGVPVFTDVATGTVITAPIKNISTAVTSVKVPDGQTVVLGGMITDSETVLERKVPWLGDLPILGNAFRFDSHNNERTELIMFLTPRIVHNEAESEMYKQIEWQRMHAFQEDAEEVHGPIFGIPATVIDMTQEQTMKKLHIDPSVPATEPTPATTAPLPPAPSLQ